MPECKRISGHDWLLQSPLEANDTGVEEHTYPHTQFCVIGGIDKSPLDENLGK